MIKIPKKEKKQKQFSTEEEEKQMLNNEGSNETNDLTINEHSTNNEILDFHSVLKSHPYEIYKSSLEN